MTICICHRISDRDITRAVREGCACFDQLQAAAGYGPCVAPLLLSTQA